MTSGWLRMYKTIYIHLLRDFVDSDVFELPISGNHIIPNSTYHSCTS